MLSCVMAGVTFTFTGDDVSEQGPENTIRLYHVVTVNAAGEYPTLLAALILDQLMLSVLCCHW